MTHINYYLQLHRLLLDAKFHKEDEKVEIIRRLLKNEFKKIIAIRYDRKN